MYKWMVALDGSDNAREAFYTTLNLMNKRTDDLFLISTVQSTPLSVGIPPSLPGVRVRGCVRVRV
jgi:hypothetical protein